MSTRSATTCSARPVSSSAAAAGARNQNSPQRCRGGAAAGPAPVMHMESR